MPKIRKQSIANADKENIQKPYSSQSKPVTGVVSNMDSSPPRRTPLGNLSNTPTKLVKTKHFIDFSSPKVIPVSLCAN